MLIFENFRAMRIFERPLIIARVRYIWTPSSRSYIVFALENLFYVWFCDRTYLFQRKVFQALSWALKSRIDTVCTTLLLEKVGAHVELLLYRMHKSIHHYSMMLCLCQEAHFHDSMPSYKKILKGTRHMALLNNYWKCSIWQRCLLQNNVSDLVSLQWDIGFSLKITP